MDKLALELCEKSRGELTGILQYGFKISGETGTTVREFLITECDFDNRFIIENLKTVFLDHKPVDNIDGAIVRENSVVSLSGAMPGLVGAIMRTGSVYSSFRSGITYSENSDPVAHKKAFVTLKLFNIFLKEKGPYFLRRGIYTDTATLICFFKNRTDEFWEGIEKIILNNKPIAGAGKSRLLKQMKPGDIFLKATWNKRSQSQ